jgi:general secretion pathway protein G
VTRKIRDEISSNPAYLPKRWKPKPIQPMKSNFSRARSKGFTLIEMLVVITIIVILAALSVGGLNFVTHRQAVSQAEVQIKLLENALEDYKLDNGIYPPTSNTNTLYKLLYWDATQTTPPGKIYIPQLAPIDNKFGWIDGTGAAAKIIDPWGQEYIYRIGSDAKAKNPDFDIVSKGKDAIEETADDIRN